MSNRAASPQGSEHVLPPTESRLAPLKRQWPRPEMLKEFLQVELPSLHFRERRLEKAQDLWDLRKIAQRRTPTGPFNYVAGGAERELSMARSREVFDNLAFHPQVLRDVANVDVRCEMAGAPSAMPLAIAPTGFTRMMHAEGEIAGARAAAAAGIPFTLSTMGTETIEDVAAAAPGGRHWFQLYLAGDNRPVAHELVSRAKDAGYDTLMVTVDTPVTGARHRDARNGMTFPPKLNWKTFADASYRVEWWTNFLSTRQLGFTNFGSGTKSFADIGRLFDPTLNFADLEWLREAWDGQLLIKGIQTADDAVRCIEHGMDGVVLSNHGGRQLDRAPVPLLTLPEVRARIGAEPTVLVDTGVMSGADVAAAVALGADGCLIGRAYLYGLMAGGAEGVARALEIFRQELTRTLQLMGVGSVDALTPEMVSLDWREGYRHGE
ncbi:alpha-hydroxy-acid oxidizing enzyme [Corynebacterium sp. 13CS0277]|uniref:alpha-hydroxy acid oxidase n=1 Tax=Corynebacterium sp. 13CS0277 TaxID=2071994 RepID=UPI000D03C95D|nr:alpha-hydroxy acid oxidase [Corynebacterium sp. 13CS0277]PRQ10316.1 alpha-hydroxy-acid oxidizing enzyme [Corynebacterium sp. 13CS0277]